MLHRAKSIISSWRHRYSWRGKAPVWRAGAFGRRREDGERCGQQLQRTNGMQRGRKVRGRGTERGREKSVTSQRQSSRLCTSPVPSELWGLQTVSKTRCCKEKITQTPVSMELGQTGLCEQGTSRTEAAMQQGRRTLQVNPCVWFWPFAARLLSCSFDCMPGWLIDY